MEDFTFTHVLKAMWGPYNGLNYLALQAPLTCPKYPSVPDSISGVPADRHSLLTWRRASTLSRPFSTIAKRWKKALSNLPSFTLPCIGRAHHTVHGVIRCCFAIAECSAGPLRCKGTQMSCAPHILLCMIGAHLIDFDLCVRPEDSHSLRSHLGLTLTNMMLSEEELTIEVACLDCVHVNLQQHDIHVRFFMRGRCDSVEDALTSLPLRCLQTQ